MFFTFWDISVSSFDEVLSGTGVMDADLSDGDFLDLFDLKDFKEDIELEIEISDSAILRLSSTEGSREFA